MNLKVSVALCTHNGALFIREQLISILGQSVPPAEIVVSDDRSTDDTLCIVRETVETFQAANPSSATRLRILANDAPLGVAKNFEQAMLACEADFIALSDQDDLWHVGRLEALSSAFVRCSDLLLVHSDARLVSKDGTPLGASLLGTLQISAREKGEIHSGDGFSTLIRRNLVTGATTMIRRELVRQAAPIPTSWIHDEWLAIVAAAIGRFDLVEEQLTDYRQHGGNQIGVKSLTLHEKISKVRAPRDERNQNLVVRAVALVSKLAEIESSVKPAIIQKARAKLVHERFRLALPANRLRRILPVLRARVRYTEFSRGLGDMVRDILQPA